MGLRNRIEEFIADLGMTTREFEIKCGLSNGSVNKMNDNTRVSTLDRISTAFPQLNIVWVRTGDGTMLREDIKSTSPPNKQTVSNLETVETRPRIPYDAEAGALTEVMDGVNQYQCEQIPVISVFPNYNFTIRITGDSMEPHMHSGDEVACVRVNESSFLQWGRIHVLDTTQGVVIKRIYDAGEGIRCVSFNPDYPDYIVPKRDIRSYNLVVGLIRL